MISDVVEMLTSSDGVSLEARLSAPLPPLGGVVVCHPHPLYGGDMDNPVVVRIAEACGDLALTTLRFNFRGVGRSAGVHGGGSAEQRDVEAALARLSIVVAAGRPIAVAGYSFGAAVAMDVAAQHPELAGAVLVAPPLARTGGARLANLAGFGDRLLVVAGSADTICPADELARLGETVPKATVHVIHGADHFFFGKLYPLGEAVAAWARRSLLRP